jgi:DNA topoisomerase-6 subunit B
VSLVSTKVPFKGTGKEFISADCVEIRSAVLKALQKCCNQLKFKITARLREKTQRDRKKELLQ